MKKLALIYLCLLAWSQEVFPLTFSEAFVAMRAGNTTIGAHGIIYRYRRINVACVTPPPGYVLEQEAYLRLNPGVRRAAFANPSIDIKITGNATSAWQIIPE